MNQPPEEATQPKASEARLTQFRIVHIMYITAVLAISLATFGPGGGLIAGTFFCAFWGWIFFSRTRPDPVYFFIAVLAIVLIAALIPPVANVRQHVKQMNCVSQMKYIALGLHNYNDTYGSLPPAYLADANGKPMHSWRVLILPFLEQQALYDQYDFNEPWDGPNNLKLLNQMPKFYACPSSDHHVHGQGTCSSYVAVVGPKTAWPNENAASFPEFTDGLSNTILLIESNETCTPWLAPIDITYDKALAQLCSLEHEIVDGHQHRDFFKQSSFGRGVLIADGSVEYLDHGLDQATWTEYLEKSEGTTPFEEANFTRRYKLSETNTGRLRIANCVRFLFFVVIVVLLPLPWVWKKPKLGK